MSGSETLFRPSASIRAQLTGTQDSCEPEYEEGHREKERKVFIGADGDSIQNWIIKP
jgi:hypothetical protein